jgi:hypothetical protein
MGQIQTTVYSRELQKQLFPDNSFYKKSISESGLAADAKTFEIPNLSNINEAKGDVNTRTVLPLPVVKNDDDKVSGAMKEFYCDPLLIENEEEVVANYSKRQNKQIQQAAALNAKCGDYAAYQWLPTKASNILVTTGTGRASNMVGLSANRLAVTKADILKVYNKLLIMNVLSVPGEMYGLLTPDAYTDLLNISDFVDYEKIGRADKLTLGIVGKICGIEMMVRSKNGHIGAWFKADNTRLRAIGTAATDRPVNLFWHSSLVCTAEGAVKTYLHEDSPTYLGTVINATVRFGAEKCRVDEAGVVALAETA